MDTTDLNLAREALRERESILLKSQDAHIGTWIVGQSTPEAIFSLPVWANGRGVKSRYLDRAAREASWKRTVAGVAGCSIPREIDWPKRSNAERYVRLAPKQLDTAYRRLIEAALQWTPLNTVP